ncbi:MAG: type I glutamate--ammonia ligase [Cellulosilyticaceae bacterium]
MYYTSQEVLQFTKENDVKFIKLAFADLFGVQKHISIMAEELERAFKSGISFDASAVKGFMNVEESDLLLFPDPSTVVILPWRPQHGRVIRMLCDIKHPDGRAFEGDGRYILKKTVAKLQDKGYTCKIGTECEFYLFELDEKGRATKNPHDYAGYCDIAPLDRGENVRREICLTLEEMGIRPETSHHEQGPGQNEIDFKYSEALKAADNMMTFKSVVKTVAAQNGLYASFLPKPLQGKSGNGLHINVSLFKNNLNIFKNTPYEHSEEAECFIAGILRYAKEMTVFLNPIVNSYQRLGEFEAPKYVTWSHQNRSQLIRIPAAVGEYARMELRSPDVACNPYLAIALLIEAGYKGIEEKISLPKATDVNLYTAKKEVVDTLEKLPANLLEAVKCGRESTFLKEVLPKHTLETYLSVKEIQWQDYIEATDKEVLEDKLYFPYI